MENYGSESDWFKKLNEDDFEQLLEEIKKTERPWYGLQFIQYPDDSLHSKRIAEVIYDVIPILSDAIRDPKSTYEVIRCIRHIPTIFQDKRILLALAERIEASEPSLITSSILADIPGVLDSAIIQEAVFRVAENDQYSYYIVPYLLERPDLFDTERVIESVISSIEKSNAFWIILSPLIQYCEIVSNERIREIVTRRRSDIIKWLNDMTDIRYIMNVADVYFDVDNDSDIEKALANAILHSNVVPLVLHHVKLFPRLRSSMEIGRALAEAISRHEHPCDIVHHIVDCRSLAEISYVKEAIKASLERIVNDILSEDSASLISTISQLNYILTLPNVQSAIYGQTHNFARAAKYDGNIWDLVSLMKKGDLCPAIYRNNELRTILFDYLEDSGDLNPIRSLSHVPGLLSVPRLFNILIKSIEEKPSALDSLAVINESPFLSSEPSIEKALLARVPDLAKDLATAQHVYTIIEEIMKYPPLLNNPMIRDSLQDVVESNDVTLAAVSLLSKDKELLEELKIENIIDSRVEEIVEMLRAENMHPLIYIGHLFTIPTVSDSEDIQSALDNLVRRIVIDIRTNAKFWRTVFVWSAIDQIRNDKRIEEAILNRLDEIVLAIRYQGDGWWVAEYFNDFEYVQAQESFVSAIADLIRKSPKPQDFARLHPLDKLLENDEIMAALMGRVDDIAFLIDNSIMAGTVLDAVMKIDVLVEDKRIKQAIERFHFYRDSSVNTSTMPR